MDSLCSAEAARLGRTIQFSDTGLHPADARHARHLDAAALGVPVIAAGIPTLMDADEGADLVLTPRALDSVIAHGSALLAGILNRAPAAPPQRGAAVLADGLTAYKIRTDSGKGGSVMRSRTPLPQRQQAHWGAFLEAAALFLALCVLGRSAALTLAAVVAAPFPAVQTALWWGAAEPAKARHPTRSRSPPPKSRPRLLPRRCRKPCRR